MRRMRAGVAAAALLGGAAAGMITSGGCGRTQPAAPAAVRGSVTFQGRPLAGGVIVFAPDREKGNAGRAASAAIGEDGWYRLAPDAAALAPGWYRVAIAEPPTGFGEEVGLPRFPPALRRPDKAGLDREVRPGQENVFHFAIEVPE